MTTIWRSRSELKIVAKLYLFSYNNDLGTQIYVLLAREKFHDETYDLRTFPTGHADTTVPFGPGF